MKTLKELNSKWYWRLIKIIFFTFVWLITLWIWYITFSYSFEGRQKTYSPENIKKLDKSVSDIKEYADNLSKKFPNKEIKYTEINTDKNKDSKYEKYRKEALIREIRYLLAMDKNIEGLTPYFPHDDYSEELCSKGTIDGGNVHINGLENYLNRGPMSDDGGTYWVDWCWIKELKEGLNTIKNYKLWSFDENLNEYFSGEFTYKDYIPLSQKALWIILWIIYFIGWLVPLLIFVFLTRALAYYVIFGKVFPPK